MNKKKFSRKCDTGFLYSLIDTLGVSGSEQDVRALIMKEIKPFVDEVFVDKMGNLIARKKGPKPRVMLAAHMDEIGLMVKSIDALGRIHISAVGGMDPITLIGQRVHVTTKKGVVHGVITTTNLSEGFELTELPTLDDLYVDLGLDQDELEKLGIEVGSYLPLEQNVTTLGNKDVISGKALDDRLGCFILVELIKRLKKVKSDTFFVFTVQEEIGLFGAKTSAYKIEPEWAVAVDVTGANDSNPDTARNVLGEGPTVTIKDSEMIANKCIVDWLSDAAKKKNIPLQRDVSDFGTTDALTISLSKEGVPAAVLGVPVRNLHSTVSVAHLFDVECAILLLETLLKDPPKTCVV